MTNVKEIKQAEGTRIKGVTFTFADCNNRILHEALEKLDNYTGFNVQDLSRFNKIKGAYDAKSKEFSRLFKKLVDKHAEKEPVTRKGPDGVPVPVLKANGKPEMKPAMTATRRGTMDFIFKDRRAFNADYQAAITEEFTVEAYRLLTEDLIKAGLTPKEIRACNKLLSDGDSTLEEDKPEAYGGDDEEDDEDLDSEAENLDADASQTPGVPPTHASPGNEPDSPLPS